MSLPATSESEAGYTLLEVLVVIAIIGIVMAALPSAYARLVPQFQVHAFADELALTARKLREEARLMQHITAIRVDSEGKAVDIDGLETIGVPTGIKITFTQPISWKSIGDNTVEFYPTGGSSGGVMELARGGTVAKVSIDWLSGAVEVIR
ncbi:prepilin-type N-terminal cleavage/methylation domain-containing protein [Kordiimonas sp.]|uniref:prepilin-type N-terminal cleavage/methylation domain-containing protein n=1 Tax=Kordiimonas sp. TaxID=1970157 RepID=UPI003A923381